jgi:hypothetical protein
MYQATLLEADRNMDIAVFCLADHDTRQFVHYITRAMLGYTGNATDLKGKPVWSVGYAVDGSQGPRFKTYVDGLIAGFAQSEDLKKRDIATEMRVSCLHLFSSNLAEHSLNALGTIARFQEHLPSKGAHSHARSP